jgi:hypothetical protein
MQKYHTVHLNTQSHANHKNYEWSVSCTKIPKFAQTPPHTHTQNTRIVPFKIATAKNIFIPFLSVNTHFSLPLPFLFRSLSL